MAYSKEKTFYLVKVESTPGTPETLTASDFDVVIIDGEMKHNIEFDTPNYNTGSHAELEDIAGLKTGTVTLKGQVRPGAAVQTPNKISKLFRGCGLIGAVEGTNKGHSLSPLASGDEVTLTIWEVLVSRGASPVGIIRKLAGCSGNFKLGCDGIGKLLIADFLFNGKYVAFSDADNSALTALNVITAADTSMPYIMSNITFTIGGTAHSISSFSLDAGNKVEAELDPSDATTGQIAKYSITERRPKFSCNPIMKAAATYDAVALAIANTKATIICTLTANSIPLTIKIPVGQLLSPEASAREGLMNWALNFKCEQNGTAASKVVADMAVESTFEILQGTKS
jgi:hypothetical protein